MNIRSAVAGDAAQIAAIYNYYIDNSHATFETERINATEMLRRLEESWAAAYPFLVCEAESGVVGYAYGRRFKPRFAYLYSIEVSVYVKHGNERQNIGTLLYRELISITRQKNFHAVIGGISLPNDASVRLHESFGFEKVAHFREVGRKFGHWIDVGYWQLLLDDNV